jgi:hypothetical protein
MEEIVSEPEVVRVRWRGRRPTSGDRKPPEGQACVASAKTEMRTDNAAASSVNRSRGRFCYIVEHALSG